MVRVSRITENEPEHLRTTVENAFGCRLHDVRRLLTTYFHHAMFFLAIVGCFFEFMTPLYS